MHLAKHILKNMRESQPSSESPLASTVISAVPAPISGQILPAPGTEMKEKLIASVKKEVKQLMEEAVTKKFVHEESGGVTTLCAAVEACLGQGLRRRALGLFKTSSTTALLHKIAKHCPEAAQVSRRVVDADGGAGGLLARSASGSSSAPAAVAQSGSAASPGPPPLKKRGSAGLLSSSTGSQQHPPQPRYLWIRLALFERQLARIIDHLVANAARYYERDALVADPDYGSILSSLLVGPCALDFTRAKTADHFWTDPPADELVQRHRISAGPTTPPSCRRPILNFRRSLNASSDDSCVGNNGSTNSSNTGSCCKEYVESFHQNSKATLLYGKNNVMVQTKEIADLMPGYLSLHQMAQGLTIKWTPNQLMNGYSESENTDKSSYWKFALNVNVDEIVYVHCHQDAGGIRGGTLILVGQDGVQRPPIHFPKGGHLLAFLSCLETGLLPHGQLDPPLWSQRGTGKVFPRFSKTRRRPLPSVSEGLINNASTDRDDENGGNGNVNGNDPAGDAQPAADYVFRIANNTMNHQEFVSRHSLMERVLPPRSPRKPLASVSTASNSSDSSSLSVSMSVDNQTPPVIDGSIGQVASIALVCSTMKRQIISRAFYGWLAYCRHLSTVRTHLSGLVHPTIIPKEGASGGLTKEKWAELTDENGAVHDSLEVYRLTYYGGIEHEIRKEVWPYLLEYYSFGMDKEERSKFDANTRSCYEATLSEWLCVEAIVKQRDKEAQAASIAKLAQNAQAKKEPTECIEVYEDNLSIISDDPPMVSPDMSESDRLAGSKKASVDLTKTNAPSIEEEEAEKGTLDSAENGNTEKSLPKDNNEAVAEIRKLAEAIVPKPNGIGLHHCSVESGSMDSEPKTPKHTSVIVTNPSVDIITGNVSPIKCALGVVPEESSSIGASFDTLDCQLTAMDSNKDGPRSNCVSPASSNGGVYSTELVESFGLNLHRIEKDVQRCDRNYWYFTLENLEKLRNVMCTWVWEHLDVGYMQGMVDLAAVLLVLTDDEASAHACLSRLLKSGAIHNFPCGQAMDHHFANMRSLIQILDCEMYELMHSYGDYTHFYFCYRWFLLDFKRELLYQDVFSAWELLWAAKHVASSHMPLFLALALLETYRDIILANTMDFTDIIKFFNEMAERHDAQTIFKLARDLVLQVQTLIENK